MAIDARYEAYRIGGEARMDEFILAAALEQGIDVVELSAHERLMRAAQHRGRRRR